MNRVALLLLLIVLQVFCFSCQEIEDYPYYLRRDTHVSLWVANATDGTVTYINRYTNTVMGTYKVGASPSRTAVDLEGNCWVGNRGDNTVHYVRTDGTTTLYKGFSYPRGVALDRSGNVWIANSTGGTIQKIGTDGTISAAVAIAGANTLYGALVDSNGYLWLSDLSLSRMVRVDVSNFPAITQVAVATGSNYGFTIDANGYVWCGTGAISKIDAKSATVAQTYSAGVGSGTTGICAGPHGKIWRAGGSVLYRLDPDTGIEDTITLPAEVAGARGLGADDMGYVYSTNYASDNVCKIEASSGQVVATIPVGRGPYTYSDLTGYIYQTVTMK
ncbi:MAG TPA: hypothetical protein PK253_17640 [Spirochaetota bacterium]|nr:hypothetical protein [Spirochaetota bacterium]